MEDENELLDSQNEMESSSTIDDSDSDTQTEENDIEVLRKQNAQLFERLQKAKGLVRDGSGKWIEKEKPEPKLEPKPEPKPEFYNEGLSVKDLVALRDIHEEDLDYLLDEAKLRKKSVSELKKDPYVKIILKTRQEERATAAVANTGTSRRGVQRDSDDEILNNFYKGKVSENPDDIQRLVEAELNQKRKAAKRD